MLQHYLEGSISNADDLFHPMTKREPTENSDNHLSDIGSQFDRYNVAHVARTHIPNGNTITAIRWTHWRTYRNLFMSKQ
ncbi:hypothetical protein DERF_014238 [Dermatophagoides farinae]|uniref:Uncharacterized protein n=1 Tax=Dermatophagoides farinae TaxID=6954 RepID=A0A922L140_DERFA|nr:hypothetical protein DERF_014238 [Dermatophagoides farinae]